MIAPTMHLGPRSIVAVGVVLAAGCVSMPGPAPAPSTDSSTKAVSSLVESARADASAGRLDSAAASMERAIRLAPRNARLWQGVARGGPKQGGFAPAGDGALRATRP